MQLKFTLEKERRSFRFIMVLVALCCLCAGKINAQPYINGNLSTGVTTSTGTAAPAGTTWSEVQPGNINAGYGANISTLTLADNFVISCGSWNITKITFFAYSTGYAGATSPFNDVRVRIFNTDPSAGAPVPVFGDLTTNRFVSSTNSNMYRIFTGAAATNRILWRIEANVPLNLTAGNYWIEWGVNNTVPLASNFTPASTVVGTVTQPGNNAKQHTLSTNAWANVLDGTSPQDFHFIIDYTAAACTGTPVPGNTLSTVTTACPGTPFTLSLQNCTPGTGVTYQWQSASATGGPYSNIIGATLSALTTSLTATTFYRCIVTCGANSGTSAPVQVALTPPSGCYCIPPASDCTDDDVLTRVIISSLNNASACGSGPPAGYSNFTALPPPDVFSGAPNPMTIEAPATYTESVSVWIDYNKNGVFEASEYSLIGTKATGATSLTGNVVIPASAPSGITRMRVRIRFATALGAGDACLGYTYGETEDYNVNITPCVPVTIVSSPANSGTTCSGSTSFTVATTGTLPAYSWQYRTGATGAWQTVSAVPPYSGVNSATLTLTNVPDAFNGYQYRALVTGACSSVDFSTSATLTVAPVVPVVVPASASICTGSIQQLALANTYTHPVTAMFNGSAGLPLTIPDDNTTGVTNVINVTGLPAGAIITNIGIQFNLTHTWVGDITMNLKAPNGQTLNLVRNLNSGAGTNSTDNFVNTIIDSVSTAPLSGAPAPRTGSFSADKFMAVIPTALPATTNNWLSLLGGIGVNGNWTLGVCDDAFIDAGTLDSWSLVITYRIPSLQGLWTGPSGTMFTNAAATVPYTAGTPANTIYVKPTVTSNYQVSFTTPTPCTSATTTVPVNVVSPLTGIVNPVDRSACVGGNATFTATAAGGPATYQWQRSTDGGLTYTAIAGATSSTLTISGVTMTMNGYRYRAVLTAAPCAGSFTTTAAVLTVNALPVITLSSADLTITPGQSTSITAASTPAAAAGGWVWTYNGSVITGNNTNTVSGIDIDELGSYQASVTDINGCKATSSSIVIGAEASDRMWIYPNPTTGRFQVRYYYMPVNGAERRRVHLFNSKGQLVEEREFVITNDQPYLQMNFDLTRQPAGVYVVKLYHRVSGKVVSGLLLKQ